MPGSPEQPISEVGGAPGGRAHGGGTRVGAHSSQRHSELEGTKWLHWWVDHRGLKWQRGVGAELLKRGENQGWSHTVAHGLSALHPCLEVWLVAGALKEGLRENTWGPAMAQLLPPESCFCCHSLGFY